MSNHTGLWEGRHDMIVTTFNLEFVLMLRLYVRDDIKPNLTIFCPIFPYCVVLL